MKHIETVRATGSSRVEKFADTMTHGLGLLLSIIAFVLLVYKAAFSGQTWVVFGFVIYGLSLMSAYLSSTMYHAYSFFHPVQNKQFRRFLLLFDHCSIFFLIAGTYTPVILIYMRTDLGNIVLILVWFFTFAGVIYKIFFLGRFRRFSLIMYLVMGWFILITAKDLMLYLPEMFLKLLFLGGVFYSLGIIFYQKKSVPFNHAIWHIFVLLGSIIHFYAIISSVKLTS